ncbi:uncharacterized protein LOC125670400 isoform X2 [Ostrea edulis]|uniref:uncharacterized protein LOC125670400 isoform X2 n=1 Tax=Ostrea edulis TaxID=37623 RepID=UPI00209558CA|nr:uncharacterized protein LOC125670400 isoform X2 [Ostrea edulis]
MFRIKIMSSIALSSISLSILFLLQTVNYIGLESSGVYLFSTLTAGIVTLIFAALSALSVFIQPSRETALASTTVFITSIVWASVGLSDISNEVIQSISEGNSSAETFSQREVLLPGHGTVALLFGIFSVCLLTYNHKKDLAAFMLLSFLLSVCVIVNTWVDFKGRSLLFISLSFTTSYISVKILLESFTRNTQKTQNDDTEFDDKRTIRFALNVLSLSPWIFRSIALTDVAARSFVWPLTSGLFLLVHGLSGLRRGTVTVSNYAVVDGLFWSSLGGSMFINVLKDYTNVLFPAVSIPVLVIFLLLALILFYTEVLLSLQYFFLSMFVLVITFDDEGGVSVAVFTWICFTLHVYGYISTLSRSFSFKIQPPVGQNALDKISPKCSGLKVFFENKVETENSSKNVFESDTMLGYSRYANLEMIGYLSNFISVLLFAWVPSDTTLLLLPWNITFGCCIQFAVGFIGFSRGQTFESSSFLIFASFWSIWGSLRALDVTDSGMSLGIGVGAFLLIGLVFIGLSITVSKAWTGIFACFVLFIITIILKLFGVSDGYIAEKIFAVLLSLALLYTFLSYTVKLTCGRDILPLGRPLLQISQISKCKDQMLWASSRKSSGVKQIAEMLKTGGICGIPSDVVYVLVACCNHPKAVERAYKTKKQAEDRPMSVWISNFRQIEAARQEFGPLLWDFLHEIWPSNVSAVVKRGEWVKYLGLEESERFVGRPDSVAIRIPDSTITCHLIDQCGPVTVTSANPTGEGDTTHHLQVLAKLGTEMLVTVSTEK